MLTEKGLPYTGTRTQATDKNYRVQSINGIKVGMVSYTHGAYMADGRKSINAIPCTTDSSQLINMFAYDRLDEFYDDMAEDIANMKAEGAEALVAYIHWGDEYHIQQNKTQEAMAQTVSYTHLRKDRARRTLSPRAMPGIKRGRDRASRTAAMTTVGV